MYRYLRNGCHLNCFVYILSSTWNLVVVFSWEPKCIFKRYLKMLCIDISTSFSSLQKFEGAAGQFRGALVSPNFWAYLSLMHELITSGVVDLPFSHYLSRDRVTPTLLCSQHLSLRNPAYIQSPIAVWSKVLPLTVSCLSPLPRHKSWLWHVMSESCQWLEVRQQFSPGTPVSLPLPLIIG